MPILGREEEQPFGVISFHNSDPARTFDEVTIDMAEIAGQCFGLALDASDIRLADQRSAVFAGGDGAARLRCANRCCIVVDAKGRSRQELRSGQ